MNESENLNSTFSNNHLLNAERFNLPPGVISYGNLVYPMLN